MDELIITSKTINNCMKIKKAFEKLKIKANFEYQPYIKCITPHNCYLEKSCIITTSKYCITTEGKKYIKNLYDQSKININ